MKKLFTLFLALIMVFYLTMTSLADVRLKSDIDTGNFTVEGTLAEAIYNQNVTLSVNSGAENLYISAAFTDNEGNFTYTFNLNNIPGISTGEYDLFVGAHDLAEPKELKLDFISLSDAADALTSINSACEENDKDEVISQLISNKILLGIDNPYFENASAAVKSEVADVIMTAAPYNSGTNAFAERFLNSYVPKATLQATETNIADIVNFFDDTYKLYDELCYDEYEAMTSANKSAVLKRLTGKKFTDLTAVRKAFNESILLTLIQTASNMDNATSVYQNYSAVFPFALSNYAQWNARNLATATKGNYYADMSELESALDTAYTNRPGAGGQTPPPSGNITPGGGSIGGGSGVSVGGEIINSQPAGAIFNDLSGYDWAKTAIEYLYGKNIVSGDGNGGFAPGRNLSRQEFVKMIIAAFGLYNSNAKCEFTDVPMDSWAYPYVASAVERQIVLGMGDGYFGANEYITRQDMFTLSKRILDSLGKTLAKQRAAYEFTDRSEISDYAVEAVNLLYEAGIVNGYGDGSVNPKGNATRAEAAMLLYKILS